MAIRTGEEYLQGLQRSDREIWLGSERVEDVRHHPQLRGGAEAIADYYDLHHREPDTLVVEDPENGEPISISHMQPANAEDLKRRHAGLRIIAELSMGVMGRTPDYMNVTFAGFAQDAERWRGPDRSNDEGYEKMFNFQRRLRREDLAATHTLVHPTINKATDGAFIDQPLVPLHKVGETKDSIIVRGARVLATLAPYADLNTVYPGGPLPPGAPDAYAVAFHHSMDTPGLVFLCRDSTLSAADPFDAPLSSRFDEQDAYCIFNDVEIPKSDVWINANTQVYNHVMMASPWWPNIMQQTTVRALVKLEFLYGLLYMMCEAVNDFSERAEELMGELQHYIEMTRSALLAGEAHPKQWENGNVTCDPRALHPLRALLPQWFVRANDMIKELGSSKLLTTPGIGQLQDPRIRSLLDEFLPGACDVDAQQRSAIFRLAWDFVGSSLGGRNELYERNYLGATKMNRLFSQRLYATDNQARGRSLVDKFLAAAAQRR